MFYDTLHPLRLHTTYSRICLHHALWQYHAPHPPFPTHTQHMADDGLHRALQHTASLHLLCTLHMADDVYTMLYESIMHHTLHFPHTQRMAGDATHHALTHTAEPPFSRHRAYGKRCSTLCFMRALCNTPCIFHTHNIWHVTHYTMLYYTLHNLHLPYTEYMANDALRHALWEYHAPLSAFPTHTTYYKRRSSPCFITHCTQPSSMHTAYDRW